MQHITWQRITGVLLGNVILGIGCALLRISGMGNDPFSAANMAFSDGFGIGLGTFQLSVNILFFIIQLIFGRSYLGFGSIINFFLLGYIVQYAGIFIEFLLGDLYSFTLIQQIFIMVLALLILTFGLSMYQTANLGVAPFDYLSLGMTDHLPTPYFINRIITDGFCVLLILIGVAVGFLNWKTSHLGIGTVLCAFCLGPLVNAFSKIHQKWIR